MFSVFEILYYSQLLASLTYFLGSLIYALPIPLYGVKKWAPRLITDSIYVIIWNSIYIAVLSFMTQLLTMLGVSWPAYEEWLNQVLSFEEVLYAFLKILISSLALTEANLALTIPLGQLMSILLTIITYTEGLISVSSLIYQYVGIFIALGILFLAIPFRVGRSAGGAMIGTSIVFYVGLPYLPQFLDNMGLNPLNSSIPSSNQPHIYEYFYQQVLPHLITSLILGPSIYIFLLLAFSAGLANVVSGYSSRLPLPIDLY
ncbi:DNA import protein CedA [Stygiolobus caldivivus]|uniref:Uncharacterized protein n=1 Tax=Stygiolobus caldivivus TaxID=2824673 RepID=A0A8D5ZJJ1_9CREN|nr:DNA import protein CedA [Stygiolobus caldivivus]BCU70666.1 hypothetical protein KN1_19630 [Stygiolobus caldivivus]